MMNVSEPRVVIGVDIGGTKILAVSCEIGPNNERVAPRALPIVRHQVQVPSEAHSTDALTAVTDAIRQLLELEPESPTAIGVGVAGFVDRAGLIHQAPNATGLIGLNLRDELQGEFGIPVNVDNDANCAARAAYEELDDTSRVAVMITLGTGIGGGVIANGSVLRGEHGFAGEIGHMVLNPDGPACPCGQHGCWERYASGSGLAYLGQEAALNGSADNLLSRAGGLESIRGEHITDMLGAGDIEVDAIFAKYIEYLALGVANLILAIDPGVVMLGGGISAHGAYLIPALTERLHTHHSTAIDFRRVLITVSPSGPSAGAIGAALLNRELV